MSTQDDRPVAVVTGANRGIGREVARQLAGRGHRVVLGSRDLERGRRVAAELDPSGRDVVACRLDVADDTTVAAMAAEVTRTLGRADVLVNNAAIDYDTDARAVTADLERVHSAFETNFFGAWRTAQALLPLLRRSPHPRIVNVSSEGGSLASMGGGTPAYSTSKAALNALTRVLAAELRGDPGDGRADGGGQGRVSRVLVNAICPGWVATDMGGRGGRPVAEGAAGIVWAATLPDDGPTGGFFRDGRPLQW